MYMHMYFEKFNSSGGILNAKLRATSSYSQYSPNRSMTMFRACGPIFDLIDLEPSVRRINGTVSFPEHPSIARQFPNAQADAKWEEDIDLIRPIAVTREQIQRMGKDPATVAKLEDKDWDLGDNAYVASLDVFHNLHCLNLYASLAWLIRLRQELTFCLD
ncbi:hypothetical protein K4F52_006658 [Lecanicillium sp. MT-2017a]|nr:hypothetical protein K4F52_006658 [Lecanicillium sp. MT-2017a]